MDRAVYEELSAKKAQLCERIQTAEASRPPQGARLRSSGIRGCFPQPVCVEATTVSEATMVGEALRWVERKEEEANEDKEWVRERNRVILEKGKATEAAGWEDTEPETQKELAEELIGALMKARL